MKKQVFFILCALSCVAITTSIYADAPVEDYSTIATTSSNNTNAISDTSLTDASNIKAAPIAAIDTANLNIAQRINRLEQQVNYLNKNNMRNQLEELRQSLQQVSGNLEIEQHKIEQLEKQLNDFYTDLDQRFKDLKDKNKDESKSDQINNVEKNVKKAEKKENHANTANTSTNISNLNLLPQKKKIKTPSITKKNVINPAKNDINNTHESAEKIKEDVTKSNTVDINDTTNSDNNADNAKPTNQHGKNNSLLTKKEAALKEQQTYQTAFDELQNRQFDAGAKKLREYLQNYPNGMYAANAHYWLGEIYFLNNSYAKANGEFDIVVNKYPSSSKVPEAMFKLAYIHDKQGKHDQAQKEYRALKKRFPNSAAAKLAEQQM